MFNSNTPFTMPVMPATGGYSDGAEMCIRDRWNTESNSWQKNRVSLTIMTRKEPIRMQQFAGLRR